jgi:hypothetical protein
MSEAANGRPDPTVTGAWQRVSCGDCERVYVCSPADDHYLRVGDPEGSPRVCFDCLTAAHGSLRERLAAVLDPWVVVTASDGLPSMTTRTPEALADAVLDFLGLEHEGGSSEPHPDNHGQWVTYPTYRLRGLEGDQP